MTNVVFKKVNDKIYGFSITGHSGYDEKDYDIVCSAISVISQTIVIGITDVLKINTKYKIKDGFLQLDLKNHSDEEIDKCQVLLETMLAGLKSTEICYSQFLKVDIEEVQL